MFAEINIEWDDSGKYKVAQDQLDLLQHVVSTSPLLRSDLRCTGGGHRGLTELTG